MQHLSNSIHTNLQGYCQHSSFRQHFSKQLKQLRTELKPRYLGASSRGWGLETAESTWLKQWALSILSKISNYSKRAQLV